MQKRLRLLLIFLALVALLRPDVASALEGTSPQEKLDAAKKLRQNGDLAAALAGFQALTRELPGEDAVSQEARIAQCDLRRDPAAVLLPRPSLEPRRVSGDIVRPRGIHTPQPVDNQRLVGRSVAEAVIDREGCVRDAKILRPGTAESDAVVLRNVATWVYLPATLNGVSVDVYLTVTISVHYR